VHSKRGIARSRANAGVELILDVNGPDSLKKGHQVGSAFKMTGVDGFCSLMGQGRKLFGCRRFRVPAFSTCSFGT